MATSKGDESVRIITVLSHTAPLSQESSPIEDVVSSVSSPSHTVGTVGGAGLSLLPY